MTELKEVHARIRETKLEKKKLKDIFRDVLAQSKPYQDALEQLNTLKAKKKQMENALREECSQELEKAEKLATDIQNDVQLLSDMAMTKMMKGETVEITDEYDVKYEPVFKVTFKKVG